MGHSRVGTLHVEAAAAAAAMLNRAFADDAFFAFVEPDPATRLRSVRWYLEATTRACIHLGGAYATIGDPIGVALWVPANGAIAPDVELAAGLDQRAAVLGPAADARLRDLGQHFGDLHRRDAPDPHRYLTILGVDPEHQGRGIGGAVLAPGLAEADRTGVACYTETTRARNVPFYERHGFVVIESGQIADVPFWTFLRKPIPPVDPGLKPRADLATPFQG